MATDTSTQQPQAPAATATAPAPTSGATPAPAAAAAEPIKPLIVAARRRPPSKATGVAVNRRPKTEADPVVARRVEATAAAAAAHEARAAAVAETNSKRRGPLRTAVVEQEWPVIEGVTPPASRGLRSGPGIAGFAASIAARRRAAAEETAAAPQTAATNSAATGAAQPAPARVGPTFVGPTRSSVYLDAISQLNQAHDDLIRCREAVIEARGRLGPDKSPRLGYVILRNAVAGDEAAAEGRWYTATPLDTTAISMDYYASESEELDRGTVPDEARVLSDDPMYQVVLARTDASKLAIDVTRCDRIDMHLASQKLMQAIEAIAAAGLVTRSHP